MTAAQASGRMGGRNGSLPDLHVRHGMSPARAVGVALNYVDHSVDNVAELGAGIWSSPGVRGPGCAGLLPTRIPQPQKRGEAIVHYVSNRRVCLCEVHARGRFLTQVGVNVSHVQRLVVIVRAQLLDAEMSVPTCQLRELPVLALGALEVAGV